MLPSFRTRGGADAENYETNPMAEGEQKKTAAPADIRYEKLPNEAIAWRAVQSFGFTFKVI